MHITPALMRRGHALVWACALGLSRPAGVAAERPVPDPQAGQAAYQKACARCHGVQGHGDGLDAKRFYPRPRDFTLGVYKFRSTASGTPPTDDDLFRTIATGLPGTNMPDWPHLDEATRWHLVDYLKSLAPIFQQAQPAPVTLPPDPGPSRADLKKGRALYEQLGCAACHGNAGRANGPSAAGLVDDWGMRIRPADLTQGWAYRGGSDPRAVALRILTGIDGAGMPSYADALSPAEDVWPLADYVASLQEPAQWNMIAHVLPVDGGLPATAADPRWDEAERTDVRLRNVVNAAGEWVAPPTVRALSFRALATRDAIALRFTWDDPTEDAQVPPDGFAVLLKPAGSQGDVVSLQVWPYQGAPTLDLGFWSAKSGQMFESRSADLEGLLRRVSGQTPLETTAHYADGRWELVVRRPRQPAYPEGAAAIPPGEFTSIAFMVWDGANPDARAVSPWVDLALPQDPSRETVKR